MKKMLTLPHTRFTLLALFAVAYVFPVTARAEDRDVPSNGPTFRSTVSEVRVTFFVTDGSRPVEAVTKSDFAVVDSELVVRNFRSLAHSEENSLDVVVLVDLSESVAPRVRTAIADVLQLVAREQSIAEDNISVVSFGGMLAGTLGGNLGAQGGVQPAVLCTSGCQASDDVARLRAVKSGGATPLYDALIFAADFLSTHRRARDGTVRPVLLLFSDGCDTFSMHSAREAVQAALDAGALIYSVDMGNAQNPTAGSIFLRQVSSATGGRYFPLRTQHARPEDSAAVLTAVLDDLRASYVVTYDLPSHQAGFHSLRLMPTHNLNLTFHSRGGYNYDPSDR
jgi:VWFA-related protein